MMSIKEISVFTIGLILVGFLYVMKLPQENNTSEFNTTANIVTTNLEPNDIDTSIDQKTDKPIIDRILDVPAWKFDFSKIGAVTVEEIIKSTSQAIDEKRFFEPEDNNALFYLINLKNIDPENDQIANFKLTLATELDNKSASAIINNDEDDLKLIISQYKTLNIKPEFVQTLTEKLSTISTINKLYAKGIQQISNDVIIADDLNSAWHTANQCLEVDPENSKTKLLVSKIVTILTNDALRAAEEIDFQLAIVIIQKAEYLSPDEVTVSFASDKINELKQQRYIWLEDQLAIAIRKTNINRANRMIEQLEDLGLGHDQLVSYQNEIKRIEIFGKYSEFDIFSDTTSNNKKLPDMVIMPLGQYQMGNINGPKHEKPLHQVTIDYGFAVSQNEISVEDFGLFIKNSDYKTDAEITRSSRIYDISTGRIKNKNRITWKNDYLGSKAKKNLPVIHVSWNDALAYTQWLSQETGKNYRLLSESEFEYILRAGSKSNYPWGNGDPVQVIENLQGKLDRTIKNTRIRWKKGFDKYNDEHWGPAPVASFIHNQFKLNDTAGNVMEWVMDCWHDSYTRAPVNGSAWVNPGCENHVIRGGSWSSSKNEFESSHRFIAKSNFTDARLGFRVAVDITPE